MRDVRAQEDARYGARVSRSAARAVRPLPSQSTALNAGLLRSCSVREDAAEQSDRERAQARSALRRLRLGPGPLRATRSGRHAHEVTHAATWRLGLSDRRASLVPAWRRHVSGRAGGVRTRAGKLAEEAQQRVRCRWWLIRRGVRKHRWRMGGEWGSWSVECEEVRPARWRASAWDAELVVLRPPRVRGRRILAEESDEDG